MKAKERNGKEKKIFIKTNTTPSCFSSPNKIDLSFVCVDDNFEMINYDNDDGDGDDDPVTNQLIFSQYKLDQTHT